VEPLLNSRWGFESNCFVCEASNTEGLRIPFLHDAEQRRVVAGFELDDRFSGAPSYVHGGIVLAVLDEAMAWAAIAVAGVFAVTKETTTRFRRPVRVGTRTRCRAGSRRTGSSSAAGPRSSTPVASGARWRAPPSWRSGLRRRPTPSVPTSPRPTGGSCGDRRRRREPTYRCPMTSLAPDLALPDADGGTWRLSDHRGRPVLLVFHRHLA
jgi:acyl-coenzyme A thioesterase PaaI-like protein